MAEILGLGLTHYPPLNGQDARMAGALRAVLKDPGLPDRYRTPAGWPKPMQDEWGDDEGLAAIRRHRAALVAEFRKLRRALDDFKPDWVLIWGDDQYENFREDIIPPFCTLAYDSMEVRPFQAKQMALFGDNIWGEAKDKAFRIPGHPKAAKSLVTGLLEQGVDMPYAYKPLHHDGLPHPFINTCLFLDYDRAGWTYPVVSMQVNCYGRLVVSQQGGIPNLSKPPGADELDPPAPQPRRCFEVGGAVARVLGRMPGRVAVIASSSWSHAFLTAKNNFIYPDSDADMLLFKALQQADWDTWRNYRLAQIEESGQQEVLNWHCLVGAMAELGRKPAYTALVQTWILNSSKAFAIFPS
jgi:hypothetical protein